MTHIKASTADLVRHLTRDAEEAEGEGQAWEAAACRVGALYLAALEREHAVRAEAARVEVLRLLVRADARQPPPVASVGAFPRRTAPH